jgi:hypothetical protein
MNSRIPQRAIIAGGTLAGGAALITSKKAFAIAGGVAVLAAIIWNAYIEERLISQVVAAGINYPAPPAAYERGAK